MAHKLLLADDSITIQKVVELTLSEEDFDVTAVGDGEAALEAATKAAPDIILADVFMPRLDGYQLCGKIKQDPALRDIPVILLAGTFENFDDALAARVGADDHLTKPFESAELISMVKRLLERSKAAPQPVQAEPVEEALFAEEVVEAEALPASDDLWSVVDMQGDDQPLADATAILTEDDLWNRARLTDEPGQEVEAAVLEEDIPWDVAPQDAVQDEEAFLEAGPADDEEFFSAEPLEDEDTEPAEATAVLDMDDFGPSIMDAHPEDESGQRPGPIELAEVPAQASIYTFDSLQDASFAADFQPGREGVPIPAEASPETSSASPAGLAPTPQAPAAAPAISMEAIREEVAKAVSQVLEDRIREALAAISREAIEQIVWEVVPDLAEEILVKEIERLKAGI